MSAKSHIQNIKYNGYTIFRNSIKKKDIKKYLFKVKELYNQNKIVNSNQSNNQKKDKYVYHLQSKDIIFWELIKKSAQLDLISKFLNDEFYTNVSKNYYNFILSYYNARSSVAKLPLHIDNKIPYIGSKPIAMQMIISLSGQQKNNGATFVVPGSHQSGLLADRKFNDYITVDLKPGDIVIWDSRLWHGAHENTLKKERWSLVVTFKVWWAKQNFNPIKNINESIYSKLNKQQKLIAGFLSIPPKNEFDRIVVKQGFNDLKKKISDY
jgi:ectoine hydroxylase-related dioxygenase (phytanoyl-CoA dioxygenase family)